MDSSQVNRCPFCQTPLVASEHEAFGDMNCPRCGAALWYVSHHDKHLFWIRPQGQSFGVALEEHRQRLISFVRPSDPDAMCLIELMVENEHWDDRVREELSRQPMTPLQIVDFIRARMDRFIRLTS